MEEFHELMKKQLGVNLTESELRGILRRYKPEFTEDGKIQSQVILQDIKTLLVQNQNEKQIYCPSNEIDGNLSDKEVLDLIREKITIKAANVRGANQYQKSFVIFGNNRNSDITKQQLASALIFRLALKLSDSHIERIFHKLDPSRSGVIKIKAFVDMLFLDENTSCETYMDLGLSGHKKNFTVSAKYAQTPVVNSYVDYSNSFQKLAPPPAESYQNMTIDELEEKISDKIVEKVNQGQNMIQSVVKAFGDDREGRMSHKITLEQLKFTIWKKFQFPVNPIIIEDMFRKYDSTGKGYILLSKFVDGIIRKHCKNEPLIEDYRSRNTGSTDEKPLSSSIINFLIELRSKIKETTNRESRAPHYLLHSANRMSIHQAREFLLSKLKFQVSSDRLALIQDHFDSGGLVDMKKLMFQAMKFDNYGVLGKDQNLIDGGAVTVDSTPLTLQHIRYTPKEIEQMLHHKILSRMKTDQSLTGLTKLLNEDGQKQRVVSKKAVRNLLSKLDVIVNQDDFDNFITKYDRGDGQVVVRSFMERIIGGHDGAQNPFIPKLDEDQKLQSSLANALSVVTGHKRDVSYLEGPSDTRFEGDLLKSLETKHIVNSDAISDTVSNMSEWANNISSLSPRVPHAPQEHSNATSTSARVRRHMNRNHFKSHMPPISESALEDFEALFSSEKSSNADADHDRRLAEAFNKYVQLNQSPRRPSDSKPSTTRNGRPLIKSVAYEKVGNHVVDGKKRSFKVNPLHALLIEKYKVSKRNTTTSHEEYGLFLRGLKREQKVQQKMQAKYEDSVRAVNEKEINQRSSNNNNSDTESVLNVTDIQSILESGKFVPTAPTSLPHSSNTMRSRGWK